MDPDVSAFTILEMLRQLGQDAGLLRAALGSVYEQVREVAPGTFDLWRGGQPFATASCNAQRCIFQYWDHGPRVDAFAVQASMWAETQIGPLAGDWPLRSAQSDDLRLVLNHAETGPEAAFIIELWRTRP